MDNREVCDKLNRLIKLDVDAVNAYKQAIDACTMEEIRSKLVQFQDDHQRHIRDLSQQVRLCGGEPEVETSWAGFLIEGFTAITSQGDHSALIAMRGNEELTNRTYQAALNMDDLPVDVRALLERNFSDEQRHLSWIKDQLDVRVWERKAA
jgi:uncharacterized protein (TIGR02284 family)